MIADVTASASLVTPGGARYHDSMSYKIEVEREDDGRWIAEVPDLPGCLAYGDTRDHALASAKALALRVLADRLENGETDPNLGDVTFKAA
jgi:predicted RNase H-like HicB family nuclease